MSNKNNRRGNHNYPHNRTNRNPAPHRQHIPQNNGRQKQNEKIDGVKNAFTDTSDIGDKKWARSDKIALGAVIISAILAWFTWRLFEQTSFQTLAAQQSANAANNSVGIAKKTFQADTAYNNKVYKQARIDSKANDEREDERDKRANTNLGIQNNALKAQIASSKQADDLFKIENEPILQLQIKGNPPIKANEKFKFNFSINNLSKYPVKQLSSTYISCIFDSNNKRDSIMFFKTAYEHLPDALDDIVYIIKESKDDNLIFQSEDPITEKQFTDIIEHKQSIFFIGKYQYENLINRKKKVYTFITKIVYVNGILGYRFMINDNSYE